MGETVTEATGTMLAVTCDAPVFPSLFAAIVTVPGATAVTTPAALTVAMAGSLLDHSTGRSGSRLPAASRTIA